MKRLMFILITALIIVPVIAEAQNQITRPSKKRTETGSKLNKSDEWKSFQGRSIKNDIPKKQNDNIDNLTSAEIIDKGFEAARRGNHAEAANWYRMAARMNNVIGQLYLGNCYRDGIGVNQDYQEAVKWFCRAANEGEAEAQVNLGKMYLEGLGVKKDNTMARKWFEAAAFQDHDSAMLLLNKMVESKINSEHAVPLDQLDPVFQNLINNMVLVEGGSAWLGVDGSSYVIEINLPYENVKIAPFYICKYEITQKEWKKVMGSNPSKNEGDDLPVESVTWDECQDFIQKLSKLTGRNFRLPTEEEWEYAAIGGKLSNERDYSGYLNYANLGWDLSNSEGKSHPVGQKDPNFLGIYDMSGNVNEWTSTVMDPLDNESKRVVRHVIRGGHYGIHWYDSTIKSRSSSFGKGPGLGLRLVL